MPIRYSSELHLPITNRELRRDSEIKRKLRVGLRKDASLSLSLSVIVKLTPKNVSPEHRGEVKGSPTQPKSQLTNKFY